MGIGPLRKENPQELQVVIEVAGPSQQAAAACLKL